MQASPAAAERRRAALLRRRAELRKQLSFVTAELSEHSHEQQRLQARLSSLGAGDRAASLIALVNMALSEQREHRQGTIREALRALAAWRESAAASSASASRESSDALLAALSALPRCHPEAPPPRPASPPATAPAKAAPAKAAPVAAGTAVPPAASAGCRFRRNAPARLTIPEASPGTASWATPCAECPAEGGVRLLEPTVAVLSGGVTPLSPGRQQPQQPLSARSAMSSNMSIESYSSC